MTEYEILERINQCKRRILGTRLFGAGVLILAVVSYLLGWNSYFTLGVILPSSLLVVLGIGLPSMIRLSKFKKELDLMQSERT